MIVSRGDMFDLRSNYVCSACWSGLTEQRTEQERNLYVVECEHCKEKTVGFVHKSFVEWKIARNEYEYQEARNSLRLAYPFLFPSLPKKSRDENLKALGF